MQDYVPVDPALDEAGEIRSLVPWLGKGKAAPVPADPAEQVVSALKYYQTSVEAAAKLGIASVFSFSAGYLDRALVCDISVFRGGYLLGDLTGKGIAATYWGGCVRLAMRIKTTSASVALTLPVLAASVEMRRAEVQYEIAGIGAGAAGFAAALEAIPISGAFNFDVFSRLNVKMGEMVSAMQKQLEDEGSAMPIGVDLITPLETDLLGESGAVRHAMLSISNGRKLADALRAAPEGLDRDLVSKIYATQLGTADANQVPDDAKREAARSWLSI